MKRYYFTNEKPGKFDFISKNIAKISIYFLTIIMVGLFYHYNEEIQNDIANNITKNLIGKIEQINFMVKPSKSNENNNIKSNVISNSKNKNDNLPQWDLSYFYKSVDDPQINLDIKNINEKIDKFVTKYSKVKFNNISIKDLNVAMDFYTDILHDISKISLYSHLVFNQDSINPKNIELHALMQQENANWLSKIIFFKYKIYQISPRKLKSFNKNHEFTDKYYNYIIDDIILHKNKELPELIEKFNIEKSVANERAVITLYDQMLAKLEFDYDGKKINLSQALALLLNEDKSVRNKIAEILSQEFEKKADLFLFVFNSLFKSRLVNDKWSNLKEPYEDTLISYKMDDKILNTMVNTVVENYNKTSHRYYKLKAKILKLPKFSYADRNAPMPFTSNKKYSWDESVNMVNNIYSNFSPKTGAMSKWFFDNGRVDAKITKYKNSGGFATPFEQFILLNFINDQNSVTTLAHEMGHVIQMKLSGEKYGKLLTSAPIPLAEIPSTFGENLLTREILKNIKNKEEKAQILSVQIEHALNSISRQVAFHVFEKKVYDLRQTKELSLEDIQKIWLETMKDQLGDNVDMNQEYKNYWLYIPHFIGSRFYTFSYSFAQLTAYSLLVKYEESLKNNTSYEFVEKYLQFIQDSAVKPVNELLKNFDIDPNNKSFWENGLKYIEDMVEELEGITTIK